VPNNDRPMIVIVSSVHDYRMKRRGSIQALADAYVRQGFRTVFLSVRFSALSLLKGDSRAFLARRANRFEIHDGVECYLWRTPLHPFASRAPALNRAMGPLHDVCAAWPNRDVDRLFAEADVVMIESGMGVIFAPRVRRLNRNALLVYRASDTLDTIGAHPALQRKLEQSVGLFDHYCLLATAMAPQFRFAASRSFLIPQGVDPRDYEHIGESPYSPGARNAVCAGSMLFDRRVFDIAGPAFPDVHFHVIGCGIPYGGAGNVHVHEEMPFRALLPYIKYADIGIAPYREAPAARYLADSSLKLTQFAHLRRPAVCPHFAVGGHPHRFGYDAQNPQSVVSAITAALADRFEADAQTTPSWDELAARLLRPQDFAQTRIPETLFEPA
jgi:2-beta-glucuronyltransferase